MGSRLFRGPSIINYREEQITVAEGRVDALTEQQLTNPALAGMLEKIANASVFEVAALRPDEKRGKNRTIRREMHRHGLPMSVEAKLVEITIPFVGSEQSFVFAPTSCNIIDQDATVHENALVVTLDDDEHLERYLVPFITRVSENLERLRKDMADVLRMVQERVKARADHRQSDILATKERNRTRSFPID
jgi:hypothetical protein